MDKQTTRCFVCDDEQGVGVVERGRDCLRLTPEGLRCCGRYVGLYGANEYQGLSFETQTRRQRGELSWLKRPGVSR